MIRIILIASVATLFIASVAIASMRVLSPSTISGPGLTSTNVSIDVPPPFDTTKMVRDIDSHDDDDHRVSFENITVSNKGLEAELREINLAHDFPTATICAEVPTIADWLPVFSATYNGQPVGIWGWMLIDPDNAYQEKKRCYMVMFTSSSAPQDFSGQLVISLEYFRTITPEKIPESLILQARENLKNKGIDFEIENISHGVNIVVTDKPDFYTEEEAEQKVLEALTERFDGPWTFIVDLGQK